MFKLIVIAFLIIVGFYYIDTIGKFLKDEKEGGRRYSIFKAILPFAYWFFPVKAKKKKRNVKPKKLKQHEAK